MVKIKSYGKRKFGEQDNIVISKQFFYKNTTIIFNLMKPILLIF